MLSQISKTEELFNSALCYFFSKFGNKSLSIYNVIVVSKYHHQPKQKSMFFVWIIIIVNCKISDNMFVMFSINSDNMKSYIQTWNVHISSLEKTDASVDEAYHVNYLTNC